MTDDTLTRAPDRELAGRVAATGDEAAFRVLYRRHTPRVWPLVLRMLGGAGAEHDAEDVVQETWIRAVGGLGRFRWDSAFGTWLTGIALNCAREVLRRRSRRGERPLGDPPSPGWRPQGDGAGPAGRLDLERAIGSLPDGYRTVLVLHDIEGFTHEEIGRRLDIAVGTSRSQLHHARRAVRRYLGATEEVP